jgi:hypothetical protein
MGLLEFVPFLKDLMDRVIPDPAQKAQLEIQLAQLAAQEQEREHQEVLAQSQTNTAEASNPNIFVAGWRPFVGWVCGVGVAYSFIVEPLMEFLAKLDGYTGAFPALDTSNLMTLMMGMLGLGYLRTKEKINGIDTETTTSAATPAAPKKKVLGIPWPF